jgi:K+-sensing histidine kinase KdpD
LPEKEDLSVHPLRSPLVIGLSILLGTLVGLGLARLGVDDPEFALLPAVVVAWLIDGAAGGLVAILIATIATWFFFTPPTWTFHLPHLGDAMAFLLYFVVTIFVCFVIRAQKGRIEELLADNRTLSRALNRALLDVNIGYEKNAHNDAPR